MCDDADTSVLFEQLNSQSNQRRIFPIVDHWIFGLSTEIVVFDLLPRLKSCLLPTTHVAVGIDELG